MKAENVDRQRDAHPEVQCSEAVLIGHIDIGFSLQQQRHSINMTPRHRQHQRSPADEEVWQTDWTNWNRRGQLKKKANRGKADHSLSLRVSSVCEVGTVRFIQQEAHTRRVTVHHWKRARSREQQKCLFIVSQKTNPFIESGEFVMIVVSPQQEIRTKIPKITESITNSPNFQTDECRNPSCKQRRCEMSENKSRVCSQMETQIMIVIIWTNSEMFLATWATNTTFSLSKMCKSLCQIRNMTLFYFQCTLERHGHGIIFTWY